MPITVAGTNITFNDSTVQDTAAPYVYNNVAVFAASGTFTVPAGITRVSVMVFGGGGGAGDYSGGSGSFVGSVVPGFGGYGGYAVKSNITVTPSQNCTVTVGAGGAGNNSGGTGATGGTSSFAGAGFTTISATGGAGGQIAGVNGVSGTGSNGDINTNSVVLVSLPNTQFALLKSAVITNFLAMYRIGILSIYSSNAAAMNTTAAQTWSLGDGYIPGARGVPAGSINTFGCGGRSGAVFVFY